MRRLILFLLTVLGCWLGSGLAGLAHAEPASSVSTNTYDLPADLSMVAEVAANRRPPSSTYGYGTYDAVDRWSHGAQVRPETVLSSSTTTHAHTGALTRAVRATTTAGAQGGSTHGDLSSPHRSGVAANSGSRVFWSGGAVAEKAALDYAKANGAKTLEMTLTGRALTNLPQGMVPRKAWDLASARFARGAVGDAHVFFGPGAPWPTSTFVRKELPILLERGNPIMQHFLDLP